MVHTRGFCMLDSYKLYFMVHLNANLGYQTVPLLILTTRSRKSSKRFLQFEPDVFFARFLLASRNRCWALESKLNLDMIWLPWKAQAKF